MEDSRQRGRAPDDLRILIVRLSAIGDTVLSMPVLCALRDRFPRATIGWVVERTSAPLLRGHKALDHLFEVPRGWLKSARAVWQISRQLRRVGFDISLDLQGLTKSAMAGRLSGARRRLGFVHGEFEGREFSTWINNELVRPTCAHVVERGLELLRPLGVERPKVEFRLPNNESAAAAATRLVIERGLGAGFAVLNAGAGWPSKLWPPERYGAVARHLGAEHCMPSLIVWAGSEEQGMAHRIAAAAGGHAYVAPPTSLVELAAVVRRAKLFVGSDTGPLHIAAATGTPCVGLYGPMSASWCGPYGRQHIALQKVTRPGKMKNRHRASNETMLAITVDDVCSACDRILESRLAMAA